MTFLNTTIVVMNTVSIASMVYAMSFYNPYIKLPMSHKFGAWLLCLGLLAQINISVFANAQELAQKLVLMKDVGVFIISVVMICNGAKSYLARNRI